MSKRKENSPTKENTILLERWTIFTDWWGVGGQGFKCSEIFLAPGIVFVIIEAMNRTYELETFALQL